VRKLVFATGNQHKVAEAAAILSSADVDVLGYSGESPVEDGLSFRDNALIKARAAYAQTGQASFADDSGLAVEILGGSPGIFSAIWSGTRDDATNRDLLLAQLKDIAPEHRGAAFICTIALVSESEEVSFTGVWPGRVALSATGENGFGYDPVFIPEGFEISAAELDPELKNLFSHRAQAMQQLAQYLAGGE
jgi:XTP/dITP diphosphohydrolase